MNATIHVQQTFSVITCIVIATINWYMCYLVVNLLQLQDSMLLVHNIILKSEALLIK